MLFQLFATGGKFAVHVVDTVTAGIVDTGGKFATGMLTLVANLPLVATTPAVPVAKFAARWWQICHW